MKTIILFLSIISTTFAAGIAWEAGDPIAGTAYRVIGAASGIAGNFNLVCYPGDGDREVFLLCVVDQAKGEVFYAPTGMFVEVRGGKIIPLKGIEKFYDRLDTVHSAFSFPFAPENLTRAIRAVRTADGRLFLSR